MPYFDHRIIPDAKNPDVGGMFDQTTPPISPGDIIRMLC